MKIIHFLLFKLVFSLKFVLKGARTLNGIWEFKINFSRYTARLLGLGAYWSPVRLIGDLRYAAQMVTLFNLETLSQFSSDSSQDTLNLVR